jgi:hypothetical protein
MTEGYWAIIDAQVAALKAAKGADDVMSILSVDGRHADHGFFGGEGGDVAAALEYSAGWSVAWMRADYYWCMRAPDGSYITYIEGDVERGHQRPGP